MDCHGCHLNCRNGHLDEQHQGRQRSGDDGVQEGARRPGAGRDAAAGRLAATAEQPAASRQQRRRSGPTAAPPFQAGRVSNQSRIGRSHLRGHCFSWVTAWPMSRNKWQFEAVESWAVVWTRKAGTSMSFSAPRISMANGACANLGQVEHRHVPDRPLRLVLHLAEPGLQHLLDRPRRQNSASRRVSVSVYSPARMRLISARQLRLLQQQVELRCDQALRRNRAEQHRPRHCAAVPGTSARRNRPSSDRSGPGPAHAHRRSSRQSSPGRQSLNRMPGDTARGPSLPPWPRSDSAWQVKPAAAKKGMKVSVHIQPPAKGAVDEQQRCLAVGAGRRWRNKPQGRQLRSIIENP